MNMNVGNYSYTLSFNIYVTPCCVIAMRTFRKLMRNICWMTDSNVICASLIWWQYACHCYEYVQTNPIDSISFNIMSPSFNALTPISQITCQMLDSHTIYRLSSFRPEAALLFTITVNFTPPLDDLSIKYSLNNHSIMTLALSPLTKSTAVKLPAPFFHLFSLA
jgi:hypothetical protein